MHYFLFCELQVITALLLIRDSYTNWSARPVSLEVHVGFSIFDFVSFLVFAQQKAWILWLSKLIIPFKIKIIEKPHMLFVLDLLFLICKKKFWNPMISGWVGALKNWSRSEFFKLQKLKFWERQFFWIVTFSNTHREKLCLTSFSTRIYWNRSLTASDLFYVYTIN